MNGLFQILLDIKGQKNHSVIIRNYILESIKLAIPYILGLGYYQYENSFYNITIVNYCFHQSWWRYPTTHIGEYFPEKRDEDMLEYNSDIFHLLSNYKMEEISENFNSHKKLKNSRTKLSIDCNKLEVRLFSEWDIDFTISNSIVNVLDFEKRVLRNFTEHISDFMPQLFELRMINIHCHLVNSNIVNEDTHSDIIYSFPVDHSKIGTSTIKEPCSILYFPLTDTEITHLRIDIRDQNGKHVEFQEPVSMCLVFKPITD